jgi:hypothetical protein
MNLQRIAEKERTDVPQLFVRAHRLFGKPCASPTSDHARWLEDGTLPSYVEQYALYWHRLHAVETL